MSNPILTFIRRIDQSAPLVWVILLLIILFLRFGLWDVMGYRPQGVHHWRQSDCASIALNYSRNGMCFLQPEIHGLIADAFQSGHVISELPIIPYTAGSLYLLFGFDEALYRGLVFALYAIGLIYLFLLARLWLKDSYWSALLPILLITSPVQLYYSMNFLSDPVALAMLFPGWYYGSRALQRRRNSDLILSLVFLTIAALLKVTAGISLVVFFILMARAWWIQFRKDGKAWVRAYFLPLISLLLSFGLIIAWYTYVIRFNQEHSVYYFGTRPMPIWALERDQVTAVWEGIRNTWKKEYFHPFILNILPLVLVVALLWMRDNALRIALGLVALGSLAFILLWFEALKDHDYYVISLYLLPSLAFMGALLVLKDRFPAWFHNIWLKIAIIPLVIVLINHASLKMEGRYHGWGSSQVTYGSFMDVSGWLEENGISEDERLICLGDYTSCYSLYLMDRKGWTDFALEHRMQQGVQQAIQNGASYLVQINTIVELPSWIMPYTGDLIGSREGFRVYRLRIPSDIDDPATGFK